jgi:class 3 adenylate cyclase
VSVLFCDVVESTALAARLGPEAMHALLNRFFELALDEVHRYEGTVSPGPSGKDRAQVARRLRSS